MNLKKCAFGCGVAALLVAAGAVTWHVARPAQPGGQSAPPRTAAYSTNSGAQWDGNEWEKRWKYTEADLSMARSLRTEGYEALTVGEFGKTLADWADEAAFHPREDAMGRLRHSYEQDGADADFIFRTLTASMNECSTRHYGGYCTQLTPSFYDDVARVRMEDVFGDKYPVFEAQVDYLVNYQVEESKLTVGERDKVLLDYRQGVQDFLNSKTEKELSDRKAMAKALEAELARLDKALSIEGMTLTGTTLDYYDAWRSGD